jgi:hypothetical protein
MEKLEQVAEGLYVSEGTRAITVRPTQISFGKYFMPSTLGHSEYEDIGARLVEASREQGQWVGMAYKNLGKQLVAELEGMYADNDKKRAKMSKPRKGLLARAYEGAKSSLFGAELPKVEPAKPEPEQPKSDSSSVLAFWLFMQGPNGPAIVNSEIREMANKGYINLVKQGDKDILMPTQKLAETVYNAQQRFRKEAQRESA